MQRLVVFIINRVDVNSLLFYTSLQDHKLTNLF